MKQNEIIGQEDLMNNVDNIFNIFTKSKAKIRPHFILTGSSGTGKTAIINYMASQYSCNFLEINAAQLTKEGTAGNSCSKALAPLGQFQNNKPTVVFVDEFDKLIISGNTNSDLAHETTNGVQNEFLKILESEVTSVFADYGKYKTIPVNKTLFVFAGAFNGADDITLDKLKAMGVKTEFLGRVGLLLKTKPLTIETLYKILNKSVLLNEYLNYYEVSKETVVDSIKNYLQDNYSDLSLGARTINTLVHRYFMQSGVLESLQDEEDEVITDAITKINFGL